MSKYSFIPNHEQHFQIKENYYSLRNPRSLVSIPKCTSTYGIDTISFRGPQVWQDFRQDIKKF